MKYSFYFTDFNHSALEKNAMHFKSINIEHCRGTIPKELEFILNEFIEHQKNTPNYVYDELKSSLDLKHNNKAYPITISDKNLLLDIESIKINLEKVLNIKIEKIYFFNLIIFKYYQRHSKEILERELMFWSNNFTIKERGD
jgi:hypothetical protein